jgi:hypothetical protein
VCGRAENADAAVGVLDDGEDVHARAARIAWVWLRRKVPQVWRSRSGADSIPCARRISHTVEGATLMPRAASSPWILR